MEKKRGAVSRIWGLDNRGEGERRYNSQVSGLVAWVLVHWCDVRDRLLIEEKGR